METIMIRKCKNCKKTCRFLVDLYDHQPGQFYKRISHCTLCGYSVTDKVNLKIKKAW